jgi:hypothetical protein
MGTSLETRCLSLLPWWFRTLLHGQWALYPYEQAVLKD